MGSVSASECLCDYGFFHDHLVLSTATSPCRRCPLGAECNELGITVYNLPVTPGYWRVSESSTDVVRCVDYDTNADTGSGCIGGSAAAACKPSLTGPLCVLCKEGAGYFYSSDDSDCQECTTDTKLNKLFAVIFSVLGATFAAGLLLFYCSLPVAKVRPLAPSSSPSSSSSSSSQHPSPLPPLVGVQA